MRRRLVLQMQCSIDGFVARPDGDLSWIFEDFDDGYRAWTVERLWRAGAHLMGGVTYGDMAAHWPSSQEPYAPPMNQIPKVVFSKHRSELPWGEARLIAGDLAEELPRLKEERGKELLAHGGARFAQSLVGTGLVDELRLVVHPIALGSGLRLFPEVGRAWRFLLVESTPFTSGAIAHVYRPASATS